MIELIEGEGLRVFREALVERLGRAALDLVAAALWRAATAVRGAATVRALRTETVDLAGDFGAAAGAALEDLTARAALAAV